jgi:ribosomal protein S19
VNVKNKNISNNSLILNNFLRKSFLIYNGKSFNTLLVKREMVGLKIGEFLFTRKIGVLHKKKNKNKIVKKK